MRWILPLLQGRRGGDGQEQRRAQGHPRSSENNSGPTVARCRGTGGLCSRRTASLGSETWCWRSGAPVAAHAAGTVPCASPEHWAWEGPLLAAFSITIKISRGTQGHHWVMCSWEGPETETLVANVLCPFLLAAHPAGSQEWPLQSEVWRHRGNCSHVCPWRVSGAAIGQQINAHCVIIGCKRILACGDLNSFPTCCKGQDHLLVLWTQSRLKARKSWKKWGRIGDLISSANPWKATKSARFVVLN
jgi:hypothetical protein